MSAISYEASPFRSHPPPTAALALMSLCSGDGERGRMEKGVELNSFPSHEFFSASFHANFHFACPKAPSLPPPFTPSSLIRHRSPVPRGVKPSPRSPRRHVLSVANKLASRVRNCLSNKNRNLLRIADHDFPRPPSVRPIIPYPIGRQPFLPPILSCRILRERSSLV